MLISIESSVSIQELFSFINFELSSCLDHSKRNLIKLIIKKHGVIIFSKMLLILSGMVH